MTLWERMKAGASAALGGIWSVPVDLDGQPVQSSAAQANYIALAAGAFAMYHLMKRAA